MVIRYRIFHSEFAEWNRNRGITGCQSLPRAACYRWGVLGWVSPLQPLCLLHTNVCHDPLGETWTWRLREIVRAHNRCTFLLSAEVWGFSMRDFMWHLSLIVESHRAPHGNKHVALGNQDFICVSNAVTCSHPVPLLCELGIGGITPSLPCVVNKTLTLVLSTTTGISYHIFGAACAEEPRVERSTLIYLLHEDILRVQAGTFWKGSLWSRYFCLL